MLKILNQTFRKKIGSKENIKYTVSSLYKALTDVPKFLFTLKKKSSKMWMNEHINDIYYNYRSRAAFKLIEINQRYNFLKPGYKIIDLGCAPGGWTQVAVEKVNSTIQSPTVLSIDKLPMTDVPGSKFLQGDIEDENVRIKIKEFLNLGYADVVMSDMAPNFSGDMDIDHFGIANLNQMCLKICSHSLRPGGTLLMKTLHGTLESDYYNYYKAHFKTFHRIKPSSSRARSSEMFYLGTGYKLNELYITLKKFEKLLETSKVSEADIKNLGKEGDRIKSLIEGAVKQSQELEIPCNTMILDSKLVDESYLPFIKAFNIDYKPPNTKNDTETDEEKIKKFIEKSDVKFSFMKKIPKNLKELKEYSDKKQQAVERRLKILKEGIDNDSLFFDDEEEFEDDKNMEYEKMDSLADIDDLSSSLFKDEKNEEEQHFNDTVAELKEEMNRIKKEMSLDTNISREEMTKSYEKFEQFVDENPDEYRSIMENFKHEENFKDFEKEIEDSMKSLHFEEEKRTKEELRILKEKNNEFNQYFKKGDTVENLWKKK